MAPLCDVAAVPRTTRHSGARSARLGADVQRHPERGRRANIPRAASRGMGAWGARAVHRKRRDIRAELRRSRFRAGRPNVAGWRGS